MGLWGHPESEQSRQKPVPPTVSLCDPLGESLYVSGLFLPPSQISGAYILSVIST